LITIHIGRLSAPYGVDVFARLLDIDAQVDVLRDLGRLHSDLAGYPPGSLIEALRANTERLFPAFGADQR